MSDLRFIFSDESCRQLTIDQIVSESAWVSYSLFIKVEEAQKITIGRLGRFEFPSGIYIYSGSARKNMLARLNRHLSKEKKLRWHIDYLLNARSVNVVEVMISTMGECDLVAANGGAIIVPGFGSSDCSSGCGSHLRYFAHFAEVS